MGFFDNKQDKESKIVFNFYTQATAGHALGVTNGNTERKKTLRKDSMNFYPRDYHKDAPDYSKRLQQEFILPIVEDFYLYNEGLSEYKTIIFALPNNAKDLPAGLHPIVRGMMEFGIMTINTKKTVEEMLWQGIEKRDEILVRISALEFNPLFRKYVEAIVDDTMKLVKNAKMTNDAEQDKTRK